MLLFFLLNPLSFFGGLRAPSPLSQNLLQQILHGMMPVLLLVGI